MFDDKDTQLQDVKPGDTIVLFGQPLEVVKSQPAERGGDFWFLAAEGDTAYGNLAVTADKHQKASVRNEQL